MTEEKKLTLEEAATLSNGSYLPTRTDVGEEFGNALQRMVDKWETKIADAEYLKEFEEDEFQDLMFSDVSLSAIGDNFADVISAPAMKASVQSKVERLFGHYGPYTLLFDGESYYVYNRL